MVFHDATAVRLCGDTTRLGVDASGRTVLLQLVDWTNCERCDRLVQRRAAALMTLPAWTISLAYERGLPPAYRPNEKGLLDALLQRREPESNALAEALATGSGRLESIVLEHAYAHLSPVIRATTTVDAAARSVRQLDGVLWRQQPLEVTRRRALFRTGRGRRKARG